MRERRVSSAPPPSCKWEGGLRSGESARASFLWVLRAWGMWRRLLAHVLFAHTQSHQWHFFVFLFKLLMLFYFPLFTRLLGTRLTSSVQWMLQHERQKPLRWSSATGGFDKVDTGFCFLNQFNNREVDGVCLVSFSISRTSLFEMILQNLMLLVALIYSSFSRMFPRGPPESRFAWCYSETKVPHLLSGSELNRTTAQICHPLFWNYSEHNHLPPLELHTWSEVS